MKRLFVLSTSRLLQEEVAQALANKIKTFFSAGGIQAEIFVLDDGFVLTEIPTDDSPADTE